MKNGVLIRFPSFCGAPISEVIVYQYSDLIRDVVFL